MNLKFSFLSLLFHNSLKVLDGQLVPQDYPRFDKSPVGFFKLSQIRHTHKMK